MRKLDIKMPQTVGGIAVLLGSIGTFLSVLLLSMVDYDGVNLPAGFIAGVASLILGHSFLFGTGVLYIHALKDGNPAGWLRPPSFMRMILSLFVIVYGIITVVNNPLELTDCNCPVGYYGKYPCIPCNCVNGKCDEGNQGSGLCECDVGWAGERCDRCAFSFKKFTGDCDVCKRGFTGEACDKCYPGYTGNNCDRCAFGFESQQDINGLVCRKCKVGHFGPYCKACTDCTLHDSLAICKDNNWYEANEYALTCTPAGSTCSDKFDCESSNCKGICVVGDNTNNKACELDDECFPGTCEFKQCCLESRHGDGTCKCGSLGYQGDDCRACPGYDGIYSETVCGGHGTCIENVADKIYVGLSCACAGSWSGDTCNCKLGLDGTCIECADGSFGANCDSCPGGSGIAQCNMHGICSDTLEGDGTCECDVDVRPGGIGAFKGDACEACLSGDFYSDQCETCPNFQTQSCSAGLTLIPGTSICVSSCGNKNCNTVGICV